MRPCEKFAACVCVLIGLRISPPSQAPRPPVHVARIRPSTANRKGAHTPNLPTSIADFGGFDSSIILHVRGGIPRPIGDSPESSSQAMLAGCNVSREIWRIAISHLQPGLGRPRVPDPPLGHGPGDHRHADGLASSV